MVNCYSLSARDINIRYNNRTIKNNLIVGSENFVQLQIKKQ